MISKEYLKLYKEFGIGETEIAEVIDGGSNLQNAAEILNHEKLHCNNHALQLPLNNGFEEICTLKSKCSKIVQLFRQSGPALNKLRAAHIQNKSKEKVSIF